MLTITKITCAIVLTLHFILFVEATRVKLPDWSLKMPGYRAKSSQMFWDYINSAENTNKIIFAEVFKQSCSQCKRSAPHYREAAD